MKEKFLTHHLFDEGEILKKELLHLKAIYTERINLLEKRLHNVKDEIIGINRTYLDYTCEIYKRKKRNGESYYVFYLVTHKLGKRERKYVKASNPLILLLLQKEYDSKELSLTKNRLAEINRMLKSVIVRPTFSVLDGYGEKRVDMISSIVATDKEFIEKWNSYEYEGNPAFSGNRIYKTKKGEFVRSKSELLIANTLFAKEIPYRYEAPLFLKGYGTVYPDFTILNVRTRTELYLEHFGLLDDHEYVIRTFQKLKAYERAGLFIGERVFFTFESSEMTFNIHEFESKFEHFFR